MFCLFDWRADLEDARFLFVIFNAVGCLMQRATQAIQLVFAIVYCLRCLCCLLVEACNLLLSVICPRSGFSDSSGAGTCCHGSSFFVSFAVSLLVELRGRVAMQKKRFSYDSN